MSDITTVILAAGDGKRMHSRIPKVMHPVCGRPMIDYTLAVAKNLGSRSTIVVTQPGKKDGVKNYLRGIAGVKTVPQSAPKGTGHAVLSCRAVLQNFHGFVLVLYGDTPLLQTATLGEFLNRFRESKATLGFISSKLSDPFGYGRVVRNSAGDVQSVVEEREATPEEKGNHEANIGIYAAKKDWLFEVLQKLKPHPVTREYYLTDIVEMAVRSGTQLMNYRGEQPEEFMGINSRKQLSMAEKILRERLVEHWMERGVTFVDPGQVYLEATVGIGVDTVIHPNVTIRGKTWIGQNCIIETGSILKDMVVGDGVHIKPYSVMEESAVAKKAQIGPFARLRPLSQVGEEVRIGNFVELKKTIIGKGSKANHLSYLGDAEIGDATNIGCGTITCNYDGKKKYPTKIGNKVFVGSDVQFVAPVKIGNEAYIGAGSTITEDVPGKALAVARGRQVNKKGWVAKRQKKEK